MTYGHPPRPARFALSDDPSVGELRARLAEVADVALRLDVSLRREQSEAAEAKGAALAAFAAAERALEGVREIKRFLGIDPVGELRTPTVTFAAQPSAAVTPSQAAEALSERRWGKVSKKAARAFLVGAATTAGGLAVGWIAHDCRAAHAAPMHISARETGR